MACILHGMNCDYRNHKCAKCGEQAVNGTLTLCNFHTYELREKHKQERIEALRTIRKDYRYYIPDGTDLGIDYRDISPWRNYEASLLPCDTLVTALKNVSISEIDQDGGELSTYGFEDADSQVQETILLLLYKFSRPLKG